MACPPPPHNDRPSAVRDFPSWPPHPNYPPNTPAQRPSASRDFPSSPPHPNYPLNTAAQRPSASRDFPALCGIAHAGLDESTTRRRVQGTIPRLWLEFLSFQRADDGEAEGPTPLPAPDGAVDDDDNLMPTPFERDDDEADDEELMSSDDADVEDLMSASEGDDVGSEDIFTYVDNLLFSRERDEYLNSDGVPEEVVARIMKTMTCEEAAVGGGGDNEICTVCQDDLCGDDRTDVGVLGCQHRFHADCIRKWLQMKNVCPLCKAVALDF